MSLKERTINVDIMRKGYTKIKYKQGDSNQILKFKFYKNGSELDLTGYVAGIFFEKPNNEILEKTGTISGNTVTTIITSGVLNTIGIIKTEVFLTKGEEVSISFTILIEVESSIDKNAAVQEKEEWDAIKDLLNKANNVAMIDDNVISANKTWSSNKIDSQIKEKANEVDLDIERKRIDNITTLSEGSTTGDAELIDARIGADGVAYNNLGGALRTQFGDVNNKLDQVIDDERELLPISASRMTILNNYGLTKISDTKYTIESRSKFNLVCIPVNQNSKMRVKVSALNSYNCLGIVYSTTTDIPEAWSGSNAKACLSMTTYDPFLGYTGTVWKTFESDIVIPSGCKMIVICIESSVTDYASIYVGTFKYKNEIEDARVGVNNKTYVNIGDAIRGQIDDINKELYKNVEVLNSIDSGSVTTLENYTLTKISDTSYTIESKSGKKLLCIPVNEGEKYNLVLSTYKDVYNCLGIVYSTTTDIPEAWSGSNAKACLSMTTYDPYFNATVTSAWSSVRGDVTIPSGCKMIVICIESTQTVEDSVGIYINELVTKFITADNIDSTLGNRLVRKTIFTIDQLPTISTGTIEENTIKVKNNDKSYFWSFNSTGSMKTRLKFYCNSNDTVGVWLWFNFNQLNYSDNMDGTLSINVTGKDSIQHNTAYSFKNGWNYVELGTFNEGYNDVLMTISYSLVRGDYILGIDSIELNYKPYKKPKILLSFDMMSPTLYTVRYPLLKSYGFPATVCNVARLTAQQRADIFADGWDWAIYSNGGISNLTIPSFTTGTEEEWTTFFKSVIEGYAEIGLFNPITYFSPNNRGSQILMNAEKNAGFRMSRIACSGNEKTGYFDKDSFFIYTLGVGGTATAANVNSIIDETIAQNKSICIFTHDVEETLSDNMNCSREVYVGILDHIKELVDADKCEVVTFRQFYQLCEPNDYAELMAIRHEKEKAYILNKLV